MPASSPSGPAKKSAEAAAADSAAAPDNAAATAADAEGVAADDVAADDDVPMNRAERRAKKKGGSKQLAVTKIQPTHPGSSHNHRNFANRRSGGGG